jgi:DNA-binding MarR family transcriptional regulator
MPDPRLTFPQLDILDSLRAGPRNATWLAEDVGRTEGTVRATLERLRQRGMVTRAEGPRAAYTLTDSGRAVLP